jgi:hypothetical protein
MKAMTHLETEQAKLHQRLQEIEEWMQNHTDQKHLLLGQKIALAMTQSEDFARQIQRELKTIVKKKRELYLLDFDDLAAEQTPELKAS